MDMQAVFNVAVGLISAMGGWLFRMLWESQSQLREDLAALERGLPQTYARRDDVRDLTNALFERMDRLEQKIDRLSERP